MHKPIIQGSVAWQDLIDQGYVVISREDYDALTKWRPIETAPKDGTEIFVYGIANGELGGPDKEPEIWKVSWLFKYWSLCGAEGYAVNIDNPTHWMPLPEPPHGS